MSDAEKMFSKAWAQKMAAKNTAEKGIPYEAVRDPVIGWFARPKKGTT